MLEIQRFPALHNRIVEVVSDVLYKRLKPTNDMVNITTLSSSFSLFFKYDCKWCFCVQPGWKLGEDRACVHQHKPSWFHRWRCCSIRYCQTWTGMTAKQSVETLSVLAWIQGRHVKSTNSKIRITISNHVSVSCRKLLLQETPIN